MAKKNETTEGVKKDDVLDGGDDSLKNGDDTVVEEGGGQQTPPKPRGKKDEETVTVSKAALDKVLERLETLEENDKKKNATIEMLESVADKARLAHYQTLQAKDGKLIKNAKVGFFNGFPVIAWAKGKDEVGFREGRMVVSQTIKVFLDKGDKEPAMEEVEYLFWAQNTSCEEGEVTATTNTGGQEYYTIQMKDGRKLTLDIRFINPF